MSATNQHTKIVALSRLRSIRNTAAGLRTRSSIIRVIQRKGNTASQIAGKINRSYGCVFHHLNRMLNDGVLRRSEKRPYKWKLSGLGQKNLEGF
ncbi:MAG: winged helix-turn-helix domain-containing protein [Promethearchaeota archaeon]